MTIMDDFSKAAHFFPLPKLPSDSETVEILIYRTIQIHDIPWLSHIMWVKYADNSLTSLASGFSPFIVSLGYQPHLFPLRE